MVLNYECIKELLLYIEEKIVVNNVDGTFSIKPITLKSVIADKKEKYSQDEIFYTLTQMGEANLIEISGVLRKGGRIVDFNICDLTTYGHQFLNDIKNPEINKYISKAKKLLGQVSMKTFIDAASTIISTVVIAKTTTGK